MICVYDSVYSNLQFLWILMFRYETYYFPTLHKSHQLRLPKHIELNKKQTCSTKIILDN